MALRLFCLIFQQLLGGVEKEIKYGRRTENRLDETGEVI